MLPEKTEAVALMRMPGCPVQAYCGEADAKSAHFPEIRSGGFLYAPFQPDGSNFWMLTHKLGIEDARNTIGLWTEDMPESSLSGTSNKTYIEQAEQLLQKLRETPLQKIILSRVDVHAIANGFSIVRCFDQLCAEYPNAVIHAFITKGNTCWIGASPEPLLTVANGELRTTSLAGTLPAEQGNDAGNWSDKERTEQSMVTDFIQHTLQQQPGIHDIQTGEPRASQVGAVVHLRTDFTAKTLPEFRWTELVQQLHPTPAIAGVPRDLALETIEQTELHRRLYYGGFFGPVSGNSCELFLNLRCMQISQNALMLFVGGGYTAESNPESEWVETEHKAQTLLSVIEKLRNFENS
jgi:isochorismate synthase